MLELPSVIMITIPGCQPIICNVVEEDDDFLRAEYPVLLYKEDPYVYSLPYVPFAKSGLISFNKNTIIGVALVDSDLKEYYAKVVTELKLTKNTIKFPEQDETVTRKIPEIKTKTIH